MEQICLSMCMRGALWDIFCQLRGCTAVRHSGKFGNALVGLKVSERGKDKVERNEDKEGMHAATLVHTLGASTQRATWFCMLLITDWITMISCRACVLDAGKSASLQSRQGGLKDEQNESTNRAKSGWQSYS